MDKTTLMIRQATTDDIALIRRLAGEAFPATYRDILSAEQLDYMMEWMYSPESLLRQMTGEGHTYFLAYEGEIPAGYVSIRPEGADVYHLEKIYVLPACQGRGWGRRLFRHAVAAVKERHPAPCTLRLNVNRHNKALQFYRHLGMHVAEEGDFPIGGGYFMNDYIMELSI